MNRIATVLLLSCALIALSLATAAYAQPTLDSLWPYQDGKAWTYSASYYEVGMGTIPYQARLIFEGSGVMAPGVEVHNLIGQSKGGVLVKNSSVPEGLSPLLRNLWRARPELRKAIEARAEKLFTWEDWWNPLLLGPAAFDTGVGFRETANYIGMHREMIADWSWWWLSSDLFAGATFDLQLVPDLADDVFLHGTVRGVAEGVVTDAGAWNNATIVDYLVDYGVGQLTDEFGTVIGTVEAQTTGWVAFVPDVGPVASYEEYELTNVDCPGGCPEEGMVGAPATTSSLSLVELPVKSDESSWGSLKASY